MRAALNGTHVSGAERIINDEHILDVNKDLIQRALTSGILPDEICITVGSINIDSISYTRSLNINTILAPSCEYAISKSKKITGTIGIPANIIHKAFELLNSGTAPGGKNMRGAIIMDASTGDRLEPDIRRGVRVSRVDYTEEARNILRNKLKINGIYHERVIDALAIATKVSGRTETTAELGWSDNPDYTTGYVSSRESGYVRITNMKGKGSARGGRVFFVKTEGLNLNEYINYLERKPVIIDSIGDIFPTYQDPDQVQDDR